jgi:hypothetical protein
MRAGSKDVEGRIRLAGRRLPICGPDNVGSLTSMHASISCDLRWRANGVEFNDCPFTGRREEMECSSRSPLESPWTRLLCIEFAVSCRDATSCFCCVNGARGTERNCSRIHYRILVPRKLPWPSHPPKLHTDQKFHKVSGGSQQALRFQFLRQQHLGGGVTVLSVL